VAQFTPLAIHIRKIRPERKNPFTYRSLRALGLGMIKPPTPPDLKHCADCGKVIGPHKGWFGPECYCGREPKPGDAFKGAHGAGTAT
jgi:hypothetical protein